MWSDIIHTLTEYQAFIISSHVNPDCDALGSELAMAYLLLAQGKKVTILNHDPTPEMYRFLDPDNLIQRYNPATHASLVASVEVIVVVDTSSWRRLGQVGEALENVKAMSVCIDHHPDNQDFADVRYINTEVIATGELIFDLITTMGEQITPIMAQSLYAAILTDSGNFRFPKTSAQTHRIIAQLLEHGADPTRIYKLIYEQYPPLKLHLKGYILQNIALSMDNQVAYMALSQQTLAQFQVAPAELNGLSGLAQQLKDVKVTLFLVEVEKDKVKISLRSDGCLAVNKIAAVFGGGGHLAAAGATIEAPLEVVIKNVLAEIEKSLSA